MAHTGHVPVDVVSLQVRPSSSFTLAKADPPKLLPSLRICANRRKRFLSRTYPREAEMPTYGALKRVVNSIDNESTLLFLPFVRPGFRYR